jgi:hypothetical protein
MNFILFFDKIWIQNVGEIECEVTSVTENSNKFQNTGFWKENSIENVVTLGPMAQATLVCIKLTSFFPTCSKPQNQCFAWKCKIVVLRVI